MACLRLTLLWILLVPACAGELQLADTGPDSITTTSGPGPKFVDLGNDHHDPAVDAKPSATSDLAVEPTADSMAADSMATDTMAADSVAADSMAADTLVPDLMTTDSMAADALVPDSMLADQLAPDLTPPLSSVGGACPCMAGLTCVSNVCRGPCTPGGACGVSASCPSNHACLITSSNVFVCVPALAGPGQPCSAMVWCPINHHCTAVGSNPAICLPVCSVPNASCGTYGAGQCLAVGGGCNLCTST